jgi:hypothetical protein
MTLIEQRSGPGEDPSAGSRGGQAETRPGSAAASTHRAAWVDYDVFGRTGLTIVFLIAQWPLLNRHALPAEEKDLAVEKSDLSD